MRSFAAGLHVLRNGRHLALAALCTLLHWGLGLAGGYLLLASFPLGAPPAWWQILLLTVVVGSGAGAEVVALPTGVCVTVTW